MRPLILSQWNGLLAQLPVESIIHQHQSNYYQAINISTQKSNSAPFVEFMLNVILAALIENTASTLQQSPQVDALLKALKTIEKAVNRDELQKYIGLKDRKSFRTRYLKPALDANLIEMTIPDKPNSKLQQYRITTTGLSVIA